MGEGRARRSRDRRSFPWGDVFDAGCCNSSELGWGATTPVGIFAEGASSYGVLDMAGNVWEWTSSLFRDYPYRSDDGREDQQKMDVRVLRGVARRLVPQ